MEPAAKKAKTEEATAQAEGAADAAMAPAPESEARKELETDARADASPKIKDTVAFYTEDTTLNVMPSAFGNMLMPLTDGGLQYLLAGARANTGLKAGRYMFEVKIMEVLSPTEDPAARQKTSIPKSHLRIGVATAGSSLFIGETADSISFDSEGDFIHNKARTAGVSAKFGSGDVVSLLLNVDEGENAGTVSLFKNGERASAPQALPESLKGKPLFPALTFKNTTLHYNFGKTPLAPLPFTCRMVQEASTKHATVSAKAAPTNGKYDVFFPVCLPDEGTFDWLDLFLEKNPQYTELSDRVILNWAEKSGLWRPKGFASRASNDKPEMGFGLPSVDDGSIRRAIMAIAPIQDRNYIVMEVKTNLLKEDRMTSVARWPPSRFKTSAKVMVGEPPAAVKKRTQELMLKQKQDASDAKFKAEQAQALKQKQLEKQAKEQQKALKKAQKEQLKKQEEAKKKLEEEEKKKEAAEKGDEAAATEEKTEEEKKAEEKVEEPEEEEEEEEKDVEMEPAEPPTVELTAEEKKEWFRKNPIKDLTDYQLSTTFPKFSVPDKDEGFDEIDYQWQKADKVKEYVKQWIRNHKMTTRIEDLQPSEWFTIQWKAWQKTVQEWHMKQNGFNAAVAKKKADKQAKLVAKEARARLKAAQKMAAEAKAQQEAARAAAEAAAKKEAQGGEAPAEGEAPEKKDEEMKQAEPAKKEEEEPEEEEEDDGRIDFEKLDVFGVEDILDVGGGEPLFSNFQLEDWTMMSLRFEIHLLTHAFRKDVNDPDRVGIHLEHLPFYYQKYFKKPINTRYYGVETAKDLLEYVRDTVVLGVKSQVVETLLPEDMESMGIFVMLTEESRRDRTRRIDLGDESAKLKLSTPQVGGNALAATVPAGAVRGNMPVLGGVVRPVAQAGATMVPAIRPAMGMGAMGALGGWRPGGMQTVPARPMMANGAAAAWRPPAAAWQGRPNIPAWAAFGRT